MGLAWDSRDAVNRARQLPATGLPTGFGENLGAAWDTFRNESLSISGEVNRMDRYGAQAERAKELGETLVNPAIGPDFDIGNISIFGRQPDYTEYDKKIDELNHKYPAAGFKSSIQLHADIVQEAAGLRSKQAAIESRATGMGGVGSFIGTTGAVLTDPLVLMTLPFGAAASSSILRAALVEAGVGAATEAVIQPEVYRHKQDIGSPYTVGDAATNVLFAGLGAGVGAAVLKGAGKALAKVPGTAREILAKYREAKPAAPTARQKAAEDYLARYTEMAESAPVERHSDLHVRTLDEAVQSAAQGRLHEVEPFEVPRETLADYEATVATNREATEAAAQDIGLDIGPVRRYIDGADNAAGRWKPVQGAPRQSYISDIAEGIEETPTAAQLSQVLGKLNEGEKSLLKDEGWTEADMRRLKDLNNQIDRGENADAAIREKNEILDKYPDDGKELDIADAGEIRQLVTEFRALERLPGEDIKTFEDGLSSVLKRYAQQFISNDPFGKAIYRKAYVEAQLHGVDTKALWNRTIQKVTGDLSESDAAFMRGEFRNFNKPKHSKVERDLIENPYHDDEILTGTGSIPARAEQARVEVERFTAQKDTDIDPLASEVQRIMERNPSLSVPLDEVIDEAGERVSRAVTAEQMLQEATRAQQIAREITSCL